MDNDLDTCHKDLSIRCLLDFHHHALWGLIKENIFNTLAVSHSSHIQPSVEHPNKYFSVTPN